MKKQEYLSDIIKEANETGNIGLLIPVIHKFDDLFKKYYGGRIPTTKYFDYTRNIRKEYDLHVAVSDWDNQDDNAYFRFSGDYK